MLQLSDRQVRIVNAFLRNAALETPPDPPSARTEVLTHIRRRLRDELSRRNDSPLGDEDLIRVLNRIQLPEKAAHADSLLDQRLRAISMNGNGAMSLTKEQVQIVEEDHDDEPALVNFSSRPVFAISTELPAAAPPPLPFGPLASSQRVWLGVCVAIAEQFGFGVAPVRATVGAIGLLTGPVAVTMYLLAYAYFYSSKHGEGAPRVSVGRVLRPVGELAAALVSMVVVFAAAVWFVDWVYKLAIGYPPVPDKWSGFAVGANRLVFWGGIFMAPFSVLAGLPVAPPWDWSIPRALRTGLIVLGILLSLAFASYLTGALLGAVRDWPI